MIGELLAVFDWRSIAVLRRNFLVYRANWKTGLLPPAMEPVIFFLVFGLGLARYVGQMPYAGGHVSYQAYIAPGLLAYTAFTTPFYESLYSAYVRMFYQKTWDGILATQVELPHLVWGEMLWAATRGFMNTLVVSLVLAGFSLLGFVELRLEWLLLMPPLAFLAGLCFAAFGLIFTATVPAIDHMNYPVFLVGMPLSLVSNTYFPLPTEHPAFAVLASVNPLYHLAETARGLLLRGEPGISALWWAFTTATGLVLFAALALRLTRRRVLD